MGLHLQSTAFHRTALQQNQAGPACCSLRGVAVQNGVFSSPLAAASRRQRLHCRAASSDTFTGSSVSNGNGSSFGLSGPGASSSKPSLSIDDISLESEV